MKILMLGNFTVPYCSEVHHAKSLEALGHEVIKLQENSHLVTGERILDEALKSDLFVWVHTHGWNNPGKPMIEVLNELRGKVLSIAYHLDLYMGLERWREYENSDYFKVDHFFTVDKLMADWLNENTNTKGHFIPAGVFHEECYFLDLPKTKDIIFVGSRGYHPEWPWRPQLIDWLKETFGDRFEHWGGDGLGVVRGADLNALYAETKIVIGDTLCPDFNYPYYSSDRLFESTGRGAFIIYPYIKGIEDWFKIGEELITYKYGDFEDLKTKILTYLQYENRREEIRMAGHLRTRGEHTYKHRWKKILNDLRIA